MNGCFIASLSYIAKHFIEFHVKKICNEMLLLIFFKLYFLGMI